MNPSIQVSQLKALVDQWRGREVMITKEEGQDVDQTALTIDHTSLQERGETIDGYVSPLSLRLHGQGTVALESSTASLPYSIYDIPVGTIDECCFDGTQIYLTTDRGVYTIAQNVPLL